MDAGGSGTQVEAGVQPETVFADMIITAPPPDLSTPPVQDAERQVEMFDIRTPPQQRNYIKFTCPLTNRAWHWDVETEDWFFEDEAEQSGWAGYESPRTNRRWWWNMVERGQSELVLGEARKCSHVSALVKEYQIALPSMSFLAKPFPQKYRFLSFLLGFQVPLYSERT
ncbi:hypothetical protein AK812_SmicGene2975 [Symbiodinium microadriaticum]|uniref:Uncharacterized protein n=1 Tax=Symbiodinium microadriaticum TaxID=2951 RepID=A0A1Q9F082_SYMMI|nr:hypothetical protein AK812_SmicGene2975 [Symbiodinium microadriaticum]